MNRKKSSFLIKRIHGLSVRTLIACVLIAVVLSSMSIGFGYSKLVSQSTPVSAPQVPYYNMAKGANEVIAYTKPGQDTVLSYDDGRLVVTIPADAQSLNSSTGEFFTPQAYGLRVTRANVATYRPASSRHYQDRYDLILVALTDVFNGRGYPTTSLMYANFASACITTKIFVGLGIDDIQTNENTYDPATGIYSFTPTARLRNTPLTINYNLPGTWTSAAVTDWYDSDPSAPEFEIGTAADLAGLAKLVNEGTEDFSGRTIQINAADPISLDYKPWIPIGTKTHPFAGSVEGNGATVTKINLQALPDEDLYGVSSSDMTAGLFGYVKSTSGNASISDLKLDDVTFTNQFELRHVNSNGVTVSSSTSVGALTGYSMGYDISNVRVSNLSFNGTSYYVGGILGRGDYTGSVTNCSVEDAIFDANASSVGGIVGILYGNGSDINVSNCYVKADFDCGRAANNGGVIGFVNDGVVGIENCYYTPYQNGFTRYEHNSYSYNGAYNVGGIVGFGSSDPNEDRLGVVINNCYCDVDAFPADRYIFANSNAEDDSELDANGNPTNPRYQAAAYEYIDAFNCSWKGAAASQHWYSAGYVKGNETAAEHTIDKDDANCWFTGYSIQDAQAFFDFISGKSTPGYTLTTRAAHKFDAVAGSRARSAATSAPTTAPTASATQAATDAPTAAPTEDVTEVVSEDVTDAPTE